MRLQFFKPKLYKIKFSEKSLNQYKIKGKKRRLGQYGELVARDFLRHVQGFKILYQNYKPIYGGEVDIICRDKITLVFIEVKTRSIFNDDWSSGIGFEAVDYKKQSYIIKGATSWLKLLNSTNINFRFDVIEVLVKENHVPKINHAQNVFNTPVNFNL